MTALTNDAPPSALAGGLGLAMASAASFGLSGSLARGLMDTGWTAGAATLARVVIASAVLLVPGILAMRGRWGALRTAWRTVAAYGLFAVAGAQLFYFLAVGHLDVGIALLIEYTAPIAVVLFLWVRKGHKPGPLTAVGAVIAALGMVLLLNVVGGGSVSLVGVGWALAAMVGASVYFVVSSDTSTGLPPIALATGGLLVAAAALGLAAIAGVLPVRFAAETVQLVPFDAPWWVVVALLGAVSASLAYVTGIAGTRMLGARLASFVALMEVVAATGFAWFLLAQTPLPIQWAGAGLVLTGVVVVKLGERAPIMDTAVPGIGAPARPQRRRRVFPMERRAKVPAKTS
ncbi:DMT family transporter [Demequina sp. TTPB684]|uniref:EamA family transporter n=1 Tax=unclassified Demequina TaxID=2620311 RepID=UPI001CF3726B|nr:MULTISPECIES: DMT family transporter [unclassified Demequina]MCB2411748.1 DMT family transporter [Demequina sp. TTPB684]UPU87306.1 DMT family transporter [Demequina sp. TMPB413]